MTLNGGYLVWWPAAELFGGYGGEGGEEASFDGFCEGVEGRREEGFVLEFDAFRNGGGVDDGV